MRITRIGAAVLAAGGLLALSTGPALADHSWGNYHWARTGAVQLNITSSVTSDWSDSLTSANSDWNQSDYLKNTLVTGSADDANRSDCAMPLGAVQVCNYAYGNTGWSGLASIDTADGTHINQASAKMNDSYLAGASAAERQRVMCQEVGHTFGLGHQSADPSAPNLGTCMEYASDPGPSQHPNQHDYDQLATIYGSHDDASTPAPSSSRNTSLVKTGNVVTMIDWVQ
ncbi:hypothetical protein GCM10009665_06970 [Kitasatospora nipponensis]|uniref:Matrixin n=1 Tax=Kitasatospora nipponensis TaxID=258049 RepID=A0ABN1VRH7_9ACTN